MIRPSAERGWVALVTLVGTTVVLLLCLVVLAAATDVLAARARAQTAADAAALAAVGSSPVVGGSGRPARSAEEVAGRNGAEIVVCRCDDVLTATVVATVEPRVRWVGAVLPTVSARAEARLEEPSRGS